MKFHMKYKNINIMSLEIMIFPDGIKVEKSVILKRELLPWSLQYALVNNTQEDCKNYLVSEWLMNRTVPDSRINIDDFLLSLYRLKRNLFGRMYGYQYTAALLSYFASYFDNYIIVPVQPVNICFIYLDGRFENLYRLYPPEKDYIAKLHSEPNSDIDTCIYEKTEKPPLYKGVFKTLSFTIVSDLPSWWKNDRNLKLLNQKCCNESKQKKMLLIADIMRDIELKEKMNCNEKTVSTDFSFLEGADTIWLGECNSDFELYKNKNTKMIERLKNEFEVSYELDQLYELVIKMKEAGYYIRNQNLGIAYKNNVYNAVAII